MTQPGLSKLDERAETRSLKYEVSVMLDRAWVGVIEGSDLAWKIFVSKAI